MLIINNYHETKTTEDMSDEEWIREFAPGTFKSTQVTKPASNADIEELRSEISELTKQVSALVSLLSSKEVIQ